MEIQTVTLHREDVDALEEAGYALARLGGEIELITRMLALTLRIRTETGWESPEAQTNVVPIR